ncbi:hypothetical protein D1872_299390 [compost metagenome]
MLNHLDRAIRINIVLQILLIVLRDKDRNHALRFEGMDEAQVKKIFLVIFVNEVYLMIKKTGRIPTDPA